MSDDKRPTKEELDEMLQHSPVEVLSMFQHDVRAPAASIESAVAILREDNLSREEEDQLIEALHRSMTKTRDACDFMLTYLERLQESRKASE